MSSTGKFEYSENRVLDRNKNNTHIQTDWKHVNSVTDWPLQWEKVLLSWCLIPTATWSHHWNPQPSAAPRDSLESRAVPGKRYWILCLLAMLTAQSGEENVWQKVFSPQQPNHVQWGKHSTSSQTLASGRHTMQRKSHELQNLDNADLLSLNKKT